MSRSSLACLLAVLVLYALVETASADEVQLRGGDRYTGRVARLAGGTLAFETPHGNLNIPWTDIVALTTAGTLRITLAGQEPSTITGIAPAEAGRVTLTPGGVVALADITALGPIEPPVTMTGGANAGLLHSSGNTDAHSLRLDADAAIRQRANRYRASAALNRVEDDGEETADNWTTSLNYDRFLTSRLFLNVNGILTNDPFRDLDLRTALGAGVGYQVFDTPRTTLTANGGVGWVNEDFITADDDSYTAVRESAELGFFIVPGRVQFFHKHDGYFDVTGDDNVFVKTQTGVRLSVVANFVTTLQYDLDYDRLPAPGRRNSDKTFALTFGYRF
jgi:putative salt-induced outer membrane protein YdiY